MGAVRAVTIRYGWWSLVALVSAVVMVCVGGWLLLAIASMLSPYVTCAACYGLAVLHAQGCTKTTGELVVRSAYVGTLLFIGWQILGYVGASPLLIPLFVAYTFTNAVRTDIRQLPH